MKRYLETLLLYAPVLCLGMTIGAYLSLLFTTIGLPGVSQVLLTLACIIVTAACQLIRQKQKERLKERWKRFGEKHNDLIGRAALITGLYAILGMLAIYETPGEFKWFEGHLSKLCQTFRACKTIVIQKEEQDA